MAPINKLKREYLKEWNAWQAARQRCGNPNNPQYNWYGGRGINVSEKWNDFSSFLRDVGPSPSGLLLDRIDNDKGYEPGNCRWTDRATQARNRTNNVWIE